MRIVRFFHSLFSHLRLLRTFLLLLVHMLGSLLLELLPRVLLFHLLALLLVSTLLLLLLLFLFLLLLRAGGAAVLRARLVARGRLIPAATGGRPKPGEKLVSLEAGEGSGGSCSFYPHVGTLEPGSGDRTV